MNKNYFASISQTVDEDGFWRVFYYAPGMGFEIGNAVYVGRSQFRDKAQAERSKQAYETARRDWS